MKTESTNRRLRMASSKSKIIHAELSYAITGILFQVHNELGRYCNEKQYGDKVEQLLRNSSVGYEREKVLPPSFTGEQNGRNKVDFLIENKIVLELKSKRLITKEDYYQTKRYLAALGKELGVLVNFRQRYLTPKRVLNVRVLYLEHSNTFVD